jgi:hypothetical protein
MSVFWFVGLKMLAFKEVLHVVIWVPLMLIAVVVLMIPCLVVGSLCFKLIVVPLYKALLAILNAKTKGH